MDTLITSASEIKSMGNGKFAGYLVRFSDETQPDLAGDFFTSATDFGLTAGEVKSTPVYYNHALDPTLKTRKIGTATMQIKDAGVWFEGQLTKSDAYIESIDKLLGLNRLGASSGTASHLVEREAKGKAFHITNWPLGLDASLTPEPCDPYNHVVSIKSAQDNLKSIADLLREIDSPGPTDEVKAAVEVPPPVLTDEPPATMEDETRSVIEALNGMSLKTYLLAMRGVMREFERRSNWLDQDAVSTKSGRTLSSANLSILGEISESMKDTHSAMSEHIGKLDGLIANHADGKTPDKQKPTPLSAQSAFMDYLYTQSHGGSMTF